MSHCCELMKHCVEKVCAQHPNEDCPDLPIRYSAKFDEYTINIMGHAHYLLDYCPWCGKMLPTSCRSAWMEELIAMDIDPWMGDIPPDYQGITWRLNRDVRRVRRKSPAKVIYP